MAVHPIEFRYGREAMKKVWDEETKLRNLIAVEVALAKAHAAVGNIPKKAAGEVAAAGKKVKLARVKEIDRQINHDLMAVVKAISEKAGKSGKYVHFGATSYDIVDTAYAIQIGQALDILEADLKGLKKILLKIARKTRNLVCIGRTHGQHATPTTYGLRFALWACEVDRHLERLREARPRLLVSKMSGAVGTGAALGSKQLQIQKLVMGELGLKPAMVSNQIIQRDRHAEYTNLLALIAQSLNKIGVNIRMWQRTETGEVYEAFDAKKQVGSSTMPHKRNPIHFERVCGLSRVITSLAYAQLQNVSSWDERDLTNSAPERITLLESSILLDYILDLTNKGLSSLGFNRDKIEENLNMSGGLVLAERFMIELTKSGMGRQEAHELMRKLAMKSYSSGKTYTEIVAKDKKVLALLTPKEIEKLSDPHTYIGTAARQVDSVLKKLS